VISIAVTCFIGYPTVDLLRARKLFGLRYGVWNLRTCIGKVKETYNGHTPDIYFDSICATLEDQAKTAISHKNSDMANKLDPMDLKQILTLPFFLYRWFNT
jgi:hypothetical protein